MPRSFAERLEEKASLSRGSFGKGSLGRYSNGGGTGNLNDAISIGSAATRHWVNSVSDIYGPDEIEELLEDLNRLELAGAAYSQSEDEVETYDYLGLNQGQLSSESTTMGAGILGKEGHSQERKGDLSTGQGIHGEKGDLLGNDTEMQTLGGDEPAAATDVIESGGRYSMPVQASRGSPTFSVRSWDSHTHYQEFKEPEDDDPDNFFPSRPMQSIVCYCDISTFKTPRTLLRVLLVVTSIACLSTVLTAGTAKMGLFALPQFPRLRIMVFVTVFTVVFTGFIIVLNISHLHALLPFEYGKMQTVVYLLLTVAYAVASTLVFQVQSDYNSSASKSTWTVNQLLVTSLLGYTCMVETLLCIFNCGRPAPPPSASKSTDIHQPYDKMVQESSTHFTLHEVTPRAVTTESIQRQLPPPSAPSPHSAEQQRGDRDKTVLNQKRQYIVNENYEILGGITAPPVKGGHQGHHPSYNNNTTNNNDPSSNAKHNQHRTTKLSSNLAQTLPSSDATNPKNQLNNIDSGDRVGNTSSHKHSENTTVQNKQQTLANSSRSRPHPSSSSKANDISSPTINALEFDKLATEHSSKQIPSQQRHQHQRNPVPSAVSNSEQSVSKDILIPLKDTTLPSKVVDSVMEGAAHWSESTRKADLIVHDTSLNKEKSDKSNSRKTNREEPTRSHHHSSHHSAKVEQASSLNQSSHSHHKHKESHHSSRQKSAAVGRNYHDSFNPSLSKNTSSVSNTNQNTTRSANLSDSKYESGVSNIITSDNYNRDHRNHPKTTSTTHATVEHHKRTSKKISSAMVPQYNYYLSNTSDIPPPLPSCPPPPLDTPPPTKSKNLPNNENYFSYYPTSKYKSKGHNYESYPSYLDNRNKSNNSVQSDNNTTEVSRAIGSQNSNKNVQENNEKFMEPSAPINSLAHTKHAGVASRIKSTTDASVVPGISSSIGSKDDDERKKTRISTTAVVSTGSTTSSTITNLPKQTLKKPSADLQSAPNKSTGAIPKKKRNNESLSTSCTSAPSNKPTTNTIKPVTSSTNQNHLDEIVSFPLDDTVSSPSVGGGASISLSNRTQLPQPLVTDHSPPSLPSSSYGGSSNKHSTKNNSQRHYVQ